MKRIVYGKVERLADLILPNRKQITIDVRSTTIDGHTMTVGGRMTFEVGTFGISRCPFKDVLYNIALTDMVTVEFEKTEDGKLRTISMKNEPDLGMPVDEWFDNHEKDLEYWRNKGALK